jgi:hypothetical protein
MKMTDPTWNKISARIRSFFLVVAAVLVGACLFLSIFGFYGVEMKKFNLGDRVKWSSQANGVRKEKTGTVVEVVPIRGRPNRDRFLSLYTGPGVGCGRDHESYVIQIEKTGKQCVNKYYWPRVSALNPVEV